MRRSPLALLLLLLACAASRDAGATPEGGGAQGDAVRIPAAEPTPPPPADLPPGPPPSGPLPLEVRVANTDSGSLIGSSHTCDGPDRSPLLYWGGAPPSTVSYAVVVDDPDAPAGTWVHWLAWGIPGTERGLLEGVKPTSPGLLQGLNSFKQIGWGGPCPPPNSPPHHYHFRVYALDVKPVLSAGSDRARLEAALQGHVVAQGEWVGLYQRKR